MIYRRSFTLVEVLVSLIIVGGAFSLFLPAIKSATGTYRTIQRESACQYLADEYFSRTVILCLSRDVPKELQTLSKDCVVEFDHDKYLVSTTLSPAEDEINEGKETFMVCLKVSVSYEGMREKDGKKIPEAIRETKLCVAPQK